MTAFLDQLRSIVGAAHVVTDADALQPFVKEYSGRYQGKALAAAKPATTEEVSQIVKLCAAQKIALVPQGGNTGLVGGSTPYDDKTLIVNLSRLNKIRKIDPENFSITVEAGCILQNVQQASREAGRYFPLSLGAEGSCQIGGNIAANAGGILTIRYGNTRDLVLGLEVVLPNGEIWHGLRSLRKDNTGYNLKHLFIGSEGTLGIITAATLKLYPDPGNRETFFMAMPQLENVVPILSLLRARFGENIQAYELIARESMQAAVDFNPQCRKPLQSAAPWFILSEVTGHSALREAVENALAELFDKNLITDATFAHNEAQRKEFWTLRESLSGGAQARKGGCIKHDISVPIAKIPEFVLKANEAVRKLIPDAIPIVFGHAGDGNLHYDVTHEDASFKQQFQARWDDVLHAVHDVVQIYDGSIAAEHGVGAFKVAELEARKEKTEMDLMRAVKRALDPQGIMNPGVVFKR